MNFKMCSFNEVSISDKIKEYLHSDSTTKDHVASSLKRVNEQLSIQNAVDKFAALYLQVAK